MNTSRPSNLSKQTATIKGNSQPKLKQAGVIKKEKDSLFSSQNRFTKMKTKPMDNLAARVYLEHSMRQMASSLVSKDPQIKSRNPNIVVSHTQGS